MPAIQSRALPLLALVLPAALAAQEPGKPPAAQESAGPAPAPAAPAAKQDPPEDRPEFAYMAMTPEHPYVEIVGIVGRDPRTGDLGAIVLSNSPGVGAMCVRARAGVGVAVVSGNADPTWPEQAIELLAKGSAPAAAIAQLKADTPLSTRDRQELVLLGADGTPATHIGDYVFGVGKTTEVAEQPDWVAFTTYAASTAAMAGLKKHYPETAGLPLPERLLVALQKTLDELPVDPKGKRGDLTGKAVSAALLVGIPWRACVGSTRSGGRRTSARPCAPRSRASTTSRARPTAPTRSGCGACGRA
jgi:hypothetical protein